MSQARTSVERPAALLMIAAAAILSAAATGLVPAQAVVENPAKPRAANAGRVVAPTEVAVISDEGTDDYYFKRPRGLNTAPDGSLALLDENQVLLFDKNGKFRANLFKKGQGPGEAAYVGACLFAEGKAVVQASSPDKLMFFDDAGKYEREIPIRVQGRSMMTALFFHDGVFYLRASEFPRVKGDPDYVDTPQNILAVDEAGGDIKILASFPTRSFVISSPAGGGGMFSISTLITAPFERGLLALTHTEDYLVKLYDPAAEKTVREFRRAYERVKGIPLTEVEKKGGIFIDGKHYTRPERKFENDVKNILARDGEIWAVTSTIDKDKGILVDVFDGEGVYRDCFFIKLPEPALESIISPGRSALDGEFLWVVERSEEEGTFTIKKYRVAGQMRPRETQPSKKGGRT